MTPFAPVGAGMVGSGFGSLAGGAISEKAGYSYELGANIGNIVGNVAGGAAFRGITHFRASRAAKDFAKNPKMKRRVVIGAYDSMSGKVAPGSSGQPLPSESVHPELLNRASKVGEYGEKTLCGNRLGACAEFMSANKLANNGSRVQNIRFTAAFRRDELIPTCENCLNVFPDAFKVQKLAKWINNVLI